METSSRTKSVERPVRAVDLFIASLDALTSLQGSSTLSASIDSDERCWLFRLAEESRGKITRLPKGAFPIVFSEEAREEKEGG